MTQNRQPRGVPVGGQFSGNDHPDADGSLSVPPTFDLDGEAHTLDQEYRRAEIAEVNAHFGSLAEKYGENGQVMLDFDDGDGGDGVAFWSSAGLIEDDSIQDLLPEGTKNGYVEVSHKDGVYHVHITDTDTDDSFEYSVPAPRGDMDAIARDATTRRATIRDAAEKVAIASAFERVSDLTGKDSITFHPDTADIDGHQVGTLRLDGTSIAIAPENDVQARAFGFHGQGVESLTVSRTDTGYAIQRTVRTPISGDTEVLTDEVTKGTWDRWKAGSL